jgi:hypothetical protein
MELLVMVSILTLILIKKFEITHHIIINNNNNKEFTRPNINALKEKWMWSDMFWATTAC